MIGQVAAKLAFKTVSSAGGALYGAASALSNTGKALGMAGKALGSAAQNDTKQTGSSTNNVIIANTGMAGSAGQQKVTGGGTLPAPKAIAKPQVSTKMPTEALLDTAVKYLSSIDKSLKSQLEFERRSYQEEAQADREAIIENKPATTFSDIKDRLSGFKSDVKDNVSIAGTVLKFAAILGGAAALIASSLDQKEFDALKQNVEQFKKTFGWLGDLAAIIPAGGIIGFLFGGKGLKGRLMGGVVGILAEAVAATVFNRMTGQEGTGAAGNNTAINLAAAGGIGYLGYRGVKSAMGISQSVATMKGAKAASQAATGFGGQRAAVRTVAVDSTKTGLAFIKGPMWRKFLAFLIARGKTQLVKKIEQRIAIALASGAIAATGVGAAFGAIGFLINLGFSLYLMYEIYQLWQQFTSTTDAENLGAGDADIEKALNETDATKVAGTAVGSNTQISQGSNQAILETIRMKESGNDYGAQNPTSTASGAYQFIDGTWQALTNKYGIGTEYSKAKYAPPEIQDAVADKYVNEILQQAGGDVSKVPIAWYTGNIKGVSSAASPEQVSAYQSDWLRIYNGGSPDVNAATNSSGLSGTVGAAVSGGIDAMAGLFGSLGSAIIKPGVARDFTPSTSNVSDRISNESMKLQNDITFGIKKEKSKDNITSPALPAGTPRGISPRKSVSNIDPNYQTPDVLRKYLAHFRMAE
jgi:hypothetical protein